MSTDFHTGDWIRAELQQRDWTVEYLARESGVGLRLLQKYLARTTEPGAQNLAKLLSAFGYEAVWDGKTRVFLDGILADFLRTGTYG